MFRFLAIIVGAGAVGTFIIVRSFGGEEGPAYVPVQINLAPKVENTSWADKRAAEDKKIRDGVARRFEGAPSDVIDLATKIANPNVLLNSYTNEILSLTRVEVNEGYGQPFPQTAPDYEHTLLREAVINGNTGAAALLLDRGADVHYNEDEMAFQSVNLQSKSDGKEYWFPNYAIGSKFLRMWLDRGGDPNATHPLYGNGLGGLIHHTPKNNLEAAFSLLVFGADPWAPIAVKSDDGKVLYEMPSYFASLANGDRLYSEVSFRLAKEGFYKEGSEDDVEAFIRETEATARRLNQMSGEAGQQARWAFQKALKEIFKSIQKSPGPEASKVMHEGYPSHIGGFFLSNGQIRSPTRSDQYVYDRENQIGPHKW
jgi:hypothetical protein